MSTIVSEFDETLNRMETALRQLRARGHGDAIDRLLQEPPRQTETVSLRDSEIVQRFRDELTDGLIRVDTAHQLLQLISRAIELLPRT